MHHSLYYSLIQHTSIFWKLFFFHAALTLLCSLESADIHNVLETHFCWFIWVPETEAFCFKWSALNFCLCCQSTKVNLEISVENSKSHNPENKCQRYDCRKKTNPESKCRGSLSHPNHQRHILLPIDCPVKMQPGTVAVLTMFSEREGTRSCSDELAQ